MKEVGVRELKQRTSEILRSVRNERETISITYRGRVIARIVPVEDESTRQAEASRVWTSMDDLAQEIGSAWPEGESALNAVHEQRREI